MVLINDNSPTLHIGDLIPHFTLPATDGLTISSQEIKDPVLVVIFSCNHCPYADAYWDRIIDLAKDTEAEGAQFVVINSNDATNYPDDSFENMKEKHNELAMPFPYCFDESQDIAKAYGALCTPHCFVFDQGRTLKYKGRIDDSWDNASNVTEHNLHDAVKAVLQGNEPPISEANAIGCSIKWK